MSSAFDYRGHLLEAVQAFLEGTPGSEGRGRHIVQPVQRPSIFASERTYDATGNVVGVTTKLTSGTDVQTFRYDEQLLPISCVPSTSWNR